ncbi:MAG: hypothetical protein KDA79_00355 [Planctomycetaceae bacterium]|nr:hypothetical protein [Planctomycetaceae bacterium]
MAPATVPPEQLATAQSSSIVVNGSHPEVIWERAIDVLHAYQFDIERENRLDGIIETGYQVGSGVLEPWRSDSVGLENRLESTLQSIRRRVLVSLSPAGSPGTTLITVEVLKEIEDMPGVAANSPGGATFQENSPLQRDLNLVVGQSTPSGWIPSGRDLALEHNLLERLRTAMAQ